MKVIMNIRLPLYSQLPFAFLCLVFLFFSFAKSAIAQDKAATFAKIGEERMKAFDFVEATKNYEQAVRSNSRNAAYQYGLAMSYYRQKKYVKVINVMEQLVKQSQTEVKYFRLLGNAYDLSGQYFKGMQTLKAGVQKHPYYGSLHLDMGIIEMLKGDLEEAVNYWEHGIQASPFYADNYYWAAKHYAQSNEKIWALIYGEIFLNIERGTKRFDEMSKLLYNTYLSIANNDKSNIKVSFKRKNGNAFYDVHKRIYELLQKNGMLDMQRGRRANQGSTLKALIKLRESFLETWLQGFGSRFPNILYNRHKELLDLGYFESYSFWLLSKANPNEFVEWMGQNKEQYNEYINWFITNSMRVDIQNYLIRMDYEEGK